MTVFKGIVIDIVNRRIFNGVVMVENGKIASVEPTDDVVPKQYILPGFVDSHIHIESSMLVPSEFARLAVRHGTVATVSDPHEIANVCGLEGVMFMIENGSKVPIKYYFGAPACVPATPFETAGATIDVAEIEQLLDRDDIVYLAEMMNWPGVLNRDPIVMAKIEAAKKRGKPVDGHAPGLRGTDAHSYASAGISTDHECFTREEALDKLAAGMLISIREGSAAKNYEALISLLDEFPGKIMFCSDDKHPDDLVRGHINELAARTLARGHDLLDLLHAFCVLPVQHYNLDVGLLQPGDPADFIIVDDIDAMRVSQTWIDGSCVYDNGEVLFPKTPIVPINNFTSYAVSAADFRTRATDGKYPVIVAHDGEIVTGMEWCDLPEKDGFVHADPSRDILKVSVVNRYNKAKPSVGFIRNFGIKDGAIASSVAHDSHNIIAVGSSDAYISDVVNLVMESRGGIAAVTSSRKEVLPLPVAGIMSDKSGEEVALAYETLSAMAREMGSEIHAPYMLISFMALLVIPSLKISDKGMFNGETFEFVG
jgi:adenine deaminase